MKDVERAARNLGDLIFSKDWQDGQPASAAAPVAHDAAEDTAIPIKDRRMVLEIVQKFLCSLSGGEGK